jgi:4'-phosphopantetheinyl transferase
MAHSKGQHSEIGLVFHPVSEVVSLDGWHTPACEVSAVYVWGVILDGSPSCLDRCLQWLDQDERARAGRFVREEDRRRFILAHGCVRALLGRCVGVDPARVEFQRGVAGKPSVNQLSSGEPPLSFNLSHAYGRALIALSRGREVGVDLERVRADVEAEKLADRYFAPSERDQIRRMAQQDQGPMFFRYWVSKEAVLKAQGIGLQALSQCEILMAADGVGAEVLVPVGSPLQDNWKIRLLSCGEGWEAAVAAQGMDWVAQCGLVR